MDQYFELTSARIRPIKRVQFSVMSPDLIVSGSDSSGSNGSHEKLHNA